MKMEFHVLMKITIVSLLLSSSVAKHSKKYNRRFRRPRVNPALCDPNIAPYGCLAVPREEDVMGLRIFKEKVSDTLMSLIWRVDAVGFLRDDIAGVYALDLAYEVINNTARLGFKGRGGKIPGSACQFVSATTGIPDGTVASRTHAILDFDVEYPLPLGAAKLRTYFTSEHPDEYILSFNCFNRNNIINGVCYGRWIVDILLRKGKVDRPPMHLIVREMWEKFGLKFEDTRNTLVWIGYECPGEVL